MRIKARALCLLLCVGMLFSALGACAGDGDDPSQTTLQTPAVTTHTSSVTTATAPAPTATETTAAPVTEPPTQTTASTLQTFTVSKLPIITTTVPTETEPTAPTEITNPIAGDPVNYLTGFPLESGDAGISRPVLVVFNNIRIATPQSGISKADIVFEIEAEGGITRILGLFYDISEAGTLGSIRSTRSAFVTVAAGFDAVMVHAGGSPQAYTDSTSLGINRIDGHSNGVPFYRDAARFNAAGYEHSLMTTGSKLTTAIKKLVAAGVRSTLKSGYTQPFSFYRESTVPENATPAGKLTTKYGSYQPFFRYNEASGEYLRFEYGAKHIDQETGGQISFKNVIALSVNSHVIAGDYAGRRDFSDVGSGAGYYLTNGTTVKITWSRASRSAPLKLWNTDGTELKLNPGKTFISYVNGIENAIITN